MTAKLLGPIWWEMDREDEGHRNYKIKWRIKTTDVNDGPAVILTCPGLPVIGDPWIFGNDNDPWAFCYPTGVVRSQLQEGDPTFYWILEQKFSTKPLKRCQETQIDDPLDEPQKVSGTFVKYTEEARTDLNEKFLITSSLEPLRGPQVEFDANRPTVKIEQNVLDLELPLFTPMVDQVNGATMWGLPARCVKLSNASWERKLYGICHYYYTRTFDFDINFNTFDRVVPDLGTQVLNGVFDAITGNYTTKNIQPGNVTPVATNPQHFIKYLDRTGNPASVLLNGAGLPADTYVGPGTGTTTGRPSSIFIQKYNNADFLTLNVPTSF